jgi:hypothetical protein
MSGGGGVLTIRRSTILADVRLGRAVRGDESRSRRPRASVSVSGDDRGSTYVDDNGETWGYEVDEGIFSDKYRARTSAYGGVATNWHGDGGDEGAHFFVNKEIDLLSGTLGAAGKAAAKAAATKKSTAKPKPASYVPPAAPSTTKEPKGDVEAYSTPPSSSSSVGTYVTAGILASAAAVFLFAGAF